PTKTVIVPLVIQTSAPGAQTSDLYVHNPGDGTLPVNITFRKRGMPETNPPQVSRTIPPHGTLFQTDVLGQWFTQPNVGFLGITVDGSQAIPVATVVNSSIAANGSRL